MEKEVHILGKRTKRVRSEKQKLMSITKAMNHFFLVSCAYLMEEYDWNDDDLIAYYTKINEWIDALDSHLISVRQVADIIEAKTGAKLI